MAQLHADVIARIRKSMAETRDLQSATMDVDASGTEARLDQTVRELQARVNEQHAALEQLRRSSQVTIQQAAYASDEPREKLKQLRAVKEAYANLTPTAPYLPSPDSVLPALIAARTLQQNVQGTKQAIASTEAQITSAEALLRNEEANLHDANLIRQALGGRTVRLEAQIEDRSQKAPAQLAKELMAAKRAQKKAYDDETQRLGDALNDFIDNYLSAMLAAEELGGPVVGDMLNVENETLAAGFTKKGKAKATKKPVSEKTRQRRIDQIWGNKTAIDEEEDPTTEAEAADAEMRELIGILFGTLIGPRGGRAYHQLERDSAASRFLVRAKIAQFHPRDAQKLRLIDFGRELDD
ncbi:uncharacterized protein CC84DRAFT_1181055 [Paraphaeosphaeria sporulosa]|uniref:Centromere protein Cenp-K n=1 Tax=Paraphaeosphaeria sporulosa TaxID=1460663 RepID=A0A177BYQ5_9PLEO|nr:uncharacterized protein CC84DRAFT_1181055 [Paraphaeosphaeria sporulosa]OAF99556.1 hypothetical protein CC84DRAFT_1181055 [Paraphaeosphaeria sporulosa]